MQDPILKDSDDKNMDTENTTADGDKSRDTSQEKEKDIAQDKTKNTSNTNQKIDTLTYHQVGEDERILAMR